MKSRNITSLFMAKSKRVDSIVIVRSLLLVTIFAVGIMSSMGSTTIEGAAEILANMAGEEAEQMEAVAPHLSIDKAVKDARRSAPKMDDAALEEQINSYDNKISKLKKKRDAIEKKYSNRAHHKYSPYPGTDEKEYQTLKKKIAILNTELEVYIGEEVKRDSEGTFQGCFTPDTKILMADGSLKNISDVVVGDILKSYNEETGSLVTTTVVKTYEFNQNHYYLINKGIKITDKHRFLTDSGWKRVCDLKVSDKIKSQGKFIEIGSIDLIAPLDIKVYNLEVDNHHSFLVSDGVDPYVVHNSCGDGDGDGDGEFTK